MAVARQDKPDREKAHREGASATPWAPAGGPLRGRQRPSGGPFRGPFGRPRCAVTRGRRDLHEEVCPLLKGPVSLGLGRRGAPALLHTEPQPRSIRGAGASPR
eukprot:scaffold3343_cov309-Prasinococcus_capsulatus_cf.AAC.1